MWLTTHLHGFLLIDLNVCLMIVDLLLEMKKKSKLFIKEILFEIVHNVHIHLQ